MTRYQALVLLANAKGGEQASAMNPAMTRTQAVEIVRAGIESRQPGELPSLLEKRVHQVCRNQRQPRYKGGYGEVSA